MGKRYKLLCALLAAILVMSLLPAQPVRAAVDVSSISVPAYSGGTSSGWMIYDGGLGTALGDTGAQSKMRIVTGTSSSQYSTYRDLLKSKGYVNLGSVGWASQQSTNNRHYKFLSPDGTYALYTYWTPSTKEVRIIVDTHVDTLRKFKYESPDRTGGNGRTEVYMYSLTASTDGFKNTSTYATENRSNSGSMFIVKMPDNSLFVVDGGTYYQMSDRACEQLYDFMRSITGVPEDEKMIINTWFVSHLHFDHCAGFPRFLHKYNTEFELLNIMYNFDIEGASQKYVRRVARLFPNARYYKQHTGETFDICGVKFDVLYTVEDRYKPNSSNKLILNDASCLGNYTEENNTSTVLRMTFDGKTMLLTGDIEKADAVLMARYPAADLKCDLMQIPHHAFDNHTTLVKTVAPTVSFINQGESAIRNRKDVYNNNAAWKPYAGTIYYAGEKTVGYAADEGVFYNKVFDTVDFIAWSGRTYEMEEENAYTSDPVADPEQYYRYNRVTTLTPAEGTYVIVDDKLDQPLFYDAVTGTAGSAVPAFHADNDEFYFADSQRRGVNWLISYTTSGSLDVQATSGTTYSGTVPIYKGTGDYWGSPTKGRYLAVANGDTYAATGMFGSWTAFTNMMETGTKPVLIDLLSGGYFLIYRYGYTSTKYYPVYRDGNNSTGWGSGKLDKSTVTGNLAYFRHRMYAYNDTPDTMLLSWTGHKDYYVNKGTPQNDIIGLLSADLRVTYNFANSVGTGEIFYDGWQGQKAGTYWLEFSNGYKSGTPGDYPVAIKYKNASGTILELGTMTVHVKNPANDPDSKVLFFDFNDDEASRLRYKNQPQYNEINFDGSNRWTYIEYHGTNKISDPTTGFVDPKAGILKIYSKTADSVRRNLSLYTYALGKTPLNYNAKDAEVIQLRFKMDNLKAWEEQAPYFRMFYYYNNGTENIYTHDRDGLLGADFVSDGKYMTMTIPILTAEELSSVTDTYAPTQTLNSCTSITGLRPCFLNLVPIDPTLPACVTFDYIYIGPEADAPVDEEENFLFFDFTDTPEDRARYNSERYNFTNFDRESNPFWATSETNSQVQVYNEREMDNREGILKVAVAETNAAGTNNSNFGPWIATTGIPGVFVERDNKPFHGLGYEPQTGDYVQVRFMLSDGVIRAGEDIPTDIVLVYDRTTDGTVARGTYDTVPTYEFKTGEYITVNFALTEEFTGADCISTIGFRFRGIKSATKGSGTLTIDYIYVGQEGTVPPTAHIVTFRKEDGTVLEEVRVPAGGKAVYTGEAPVKSYDQEKHYTFAGWVDGQGSPAELENITADMTVYPSFAGEVHSYENGLCICGAEKKDPIEDQGLKLNHSLNLAGDITLNYAVAADKLAGFDMDTVVVEVQIPVYEGNVLVGQDSVTLKPELHGSYYYFPLEGMTAVHMNNVLTAVLRGRKDGQDFCSPEDSYGIADYAYSQLTKEKTPESLKALCAQLLRYGTAAQSYKGYRTDALPDRAMTQEQRAYLTEEESVVFGNHNTQGSELASPPVTWLGKALDLNTRVTIVYIADTAGYTGNAEDLSLKVTYEDYKGERKETVLTDPQPYGNREDWIAFHFDGLLAAELRSVVVAQVYSGTTPVSNSMSYSADTYGNGKDGKLLTLCKALFAYSDSAKNYFTAVE